VSGRRSGAAALSRRALANALALTAGLMLTSCGSTTAPKAAPRVSTLTRSSPLLTTPRRRHPARPTGTRVGVRQRVPATGTSLVVTVSKVTDPLRGSGAKVPAGMNPVAVLVEVRNAGPGGYDSSYTSDFSLLYPGGHAIPVFAPAGVCKTMVQDFMNELGPGESRTGCITYLVPRGKAPTVVRLAPDGGMAGHSVAWVVP
jgi:hypothetical protein